MDPRWRDLPHTDTRFTPRHYHDLGAWERRRAHLRRQILWAAGLWPTPEKTPLNPRFFGQKIRDGYTVENVCFESLPGLYVCGNLYRPQATRARSHPGVLNPHGHAPNGRLYDEVISSYPARCITFARLGCVAFVWDMVDYNDSARQLAGDYQPDDYWDVHNDSLPHGRHECSLWNINSFGLQLWNSIRALDFLRSLPEVDPDRLACTGESGGGTQTLMLGAVDDRLTIAAPVCMVSAHMQGGCGCENAPGLRFETNNVELTALIAPRPILIVSATGDWTTDSPTVEMPALRSVYALYGAADRLDHRHFDAGHGYNVAMREAVYPWVLKQFGMPCEESYREPPYQAESREDTLAFASGLPDNAVRSHEGLVGQLIVAAQRPLRHGRSAEVADRKRRGEGLCLSAGITSVSPAQVRYQRRGDGDLAGLAYEDGVLLGEGRGVEVPLWTFGPAGEGGDTATLLVHGEGRTALLESADLVRQLLASGQTVYAMDPFGIGDAAGEPGGVELRANRSLQPGARIPWRARYFETFNRSDDAERIYDIVLAVGFCGRRGCLNVVGLGAAGPWALVAGAVVAQGESTHQDLRLAIDAARFDTASATAYLEKLFIPGILRAGGLPNAAALVAPRALLLHNTGGVFDTSWAEEAYEAFGGSGAQAQVFVKNGLASPAELAAFLFAG